MSAGRTQTPTLINMPPPPQDPMTPSDAPGTPNSTTTSMSELSTVAIKDGHRGHLPHHHAPMDAERADRISRLAGLDRLGPPSRTHSGSNAGGSSSATAAGIGSQGREQHPLATAYFDANNQPQIARERSTVGSASATGSVGGRTTWASGSDVMEDKMSEDTNMADVDSSSVGGFSDEGATSLVGFGEGARTPARPLNALATPPANAPAVPKAPAALSRGGQTPQSQIEAQKQDAKMIDGMTYDSGVVDTVNRTPPPVED